jgi:hypothetical protein
MPEHGGPVSPPLIRLTKCSGLSSVKLSACNIFRQTSWKASTESSWICSKATNPCMYTLRCSTTLHSILQSRLILTRRRSTISLMAYPPSFRSTLCSTPIRLSWNLWAMPLLQMTPTVLIRKTRRRRHWWPQLAVLFTSIGWYVLHITTHHISWLLVHRRIRISCLELWHPHRPCCTHSNKRRVWFHTRATIVVRLVISPRNVPHRGRLLRLDFRVTLTIHWELLLLRLAE